MLSPPILFLIIDNAKDRDKMVEIYKEYRSLMLYIAQGILSDYALAEDAVSESFIKIINNIEKISEIKCHETKGYIVTVVEHTAIDILRKRKTHREDSDFELDSLPDSDVSILGRLTAEEGCDNIIKAIMSLKNSLAYVLYLHAVKGYSEKKIAEELGIKYDTVRQRLARARKKIRRILGGEENGEQK